MMTLSPVRDRGTVAANGEATSGSARRLLQDFPVSLLLLSGVVTSIGYNEVGMSAIDKLVARFKAAPADFTWDELKPFIKKGSLLSRVAP